MESPEVFARRAQRFASKRTAYRNKPHAFCRRLFITAHKFIASLLTRYSSMQHGFRLSNMNLMDRIPANIINSNGQLDNGLSDAAFVARRDTDHCYVHRSDFTLRELDYIVIISFAYIL
jgi:hypothetical protein